MEESRRLIRSWAQIKHWLAENFPETLDNLYSPAFQTQIDAAESTIGVRFPDALRTLLLLHNGENNHWPNGIFANGHRFLPTEDIVELWYMTREYNSDWEISEAPSNEKIWLPISISPSNAMRFLDFNPAQGGAIGQVAEVDLGQHRYRVLAPSFVDYVETYAIDLAVNKYAVKGDRIQRLNNNQNPPKPHNLNAPPPRLTPYRPESAFSIKDNEKEVVEKSVKKGIKVSVKNNAKPSAKENIQESVKESIKQQSVNPTVDQMESGERLILIGEMTSLMGKEAMLFSIETEHAKEYTFLAKPSFTRGFSNIAIGQHARIVAKKFHGEIRSHFIEQGLANYPDFVALEYIVLAEESHAIAKAATPPPENIDQLAHTILDSIQLNFQRHLDYKEVKSEQCSYLRSKFLNSNTERLLKLGFHYTVDLENPAGAKSAAEVPAFFRVMSFFDDGIVASFYHIKPKFSWPFHAARKVIEFETQLSDGHVIISTTAPNDADYPLPKSIARYVHPPSIPLEGLLHKHRSKIRRYQTHNPESAIVKVRNKREFIESRQHRQQVIYDHLRSIGWVTKEYLAKQFNNKEIAEQVYDRIKQFAGH